MAASRLLPGGSLFSQPEVEGAQKLLRAMFRRQGQGSPLVVSIGSGGCTVGFQDAVDLSQELAIITIISDVGVVV